MYISSFCSSRRTFEDVVSNRISLMSQRWDETAKQIRESIFKKKIVGALHFFVCAWILVLSRPSPHGHGHQKLDILPCLLRRIGGVGRRSVSDSRQRYKRQRQTNFKIASNAFVHSVLY